MAFVGKQIQTAASRISGCRHRGLAILANRLSGNAPNGTEAHRSRHSGFNLHIGRTVFRGDGPANVQVEAGILSSFHFGDEFRGDQLVP